MLASTLAVTTKVAGCVATLYNLPGRFGRSVIRRTPCKQSEIAEMAGLSRNSAVPVLRRLATEGLIQIGRNQVRYNPVHLRRA